jgi:hypothetical protein
MKNCRNYKIFRGLNCKKLETAPMVAGGYYFSNSRRSRAWEVARSKANERGRRGDSIPYLTYRVDASWWSNSAGEEAAVALFRAVPLLFVAAACRGSGLQERGAHKGRSGAAVARRHGCSKDSGWAWRSMAHRGRGDAAAGGDAQQQKNELVAVLWWRTRA